MSSTKLEDLSDLENENELELFENESETEGFVVEQKPKKKEETIEDLNKRIIKIFYDKVKEPILVTILVIILTHPALIKVIFSMPYIEVVDKTITVNVVIAILIGILFFFMREIL
jgi:hypothetical protein